jgi:hypothetical protein
MAWRGVDILTIPYSVEITLGGNVYTYPNGTPLKNYFVTNPAPGIYNFHYGDPFAPIDDVVHLGPHHIKIVENGATIFDADNDHHGWNQDWTHRTGPFVLHKSPADVVAANLLPPYGPNGNRVGAVANYQFKAGAFFDSAGVTIYMPTTGERPDIGMITDPAGFYMLTGQSGPMLAWARAGGSCPNHWRDTATGLTVNIVTYPGLNSADAPGLQFIPGKPSPYVFKGPRNPADGNYPNYADKWTPQPAHYCDMHYLAAVVTHDPVFLKDLQDSAAFTLGQSLEIYLPLPDGRRVQAGEYRGIAHGLGQSIKARAATIDAENKGWFVPGYHTPSSYYDATLAPSVIYYGGKFATDPVSIRFNVIPCSTLGPWQHGYLVMDLALGVLTGAPGVEALFIHAIKNTVARFSGKSGWPIAWSAYYLDLYADNGTLLPDWGAAFDHFYQTEQANAVTAAAHGQSYTPAIDTATYNKLKADPTNGFVMLGTPEYMMTDRAGLVFADHLEKIGKCSVRAQVPYFDAALGNAEAFFHKYGSVNPRVALADPGVIPPVVIPPPPPPPPTNPTQGNIAMSTPVLNGPFTATVHFFDDAEVERSVDSVDWSATGAAHVEPSTGNVASGTYNGTGGFEITAVGHIAGAPDVTVKVGGTVPVPFPTHGRIDLS